MCYRDTIVEGPRSPLCQNDANPLASCWMTSTEGVRPLKMTSFLWVKRDHNVEKIVCHSASRRNGLSPSNCQNASSDDTARRLTLAACHTAWARGQAKNKCEQSSTAPAHSGHSTGEFWTIRCRSALVIRRRSARSKAKTLIFKGRWCFHTKWHCCKMSGSSGTSWSRRSR